MGWRRSRDDGFDPMLPSDATKLLFAPLRRGVATTSAVSHFGANGCRWYIDMGHPEYATPECATVDELVAAERAGDLLNALAALAAPTGVELHIIKNNVDSEGTTFGSHENYSMSRRWNVTEWAVSAAVHLMSRVVLTGPGGIHGGQFVISPRATRMSTIIAESAINAKPMIITRDEPHADKTRWRRVQVACGDSLMGQTSSHLRFSSTSAVLRLLDDDPHALDDLATINPVDALRQFGTDPDCQTRVDTGRGKLRAVEIQAEIFERVARHCDAQGYGPAGKAGIERWAQMIDVLLTDPSAPAKQLDWVARRRVLDAVRHRHDVGWDSAKVARADLAFSEVDPLRSIARRLEATGKLDKVVDDELVAAALTGAPAGRPADRGAVVRWGCRLPSSSKTRVHTVNWAEVVVEHNGVKYTFNLSDPGGTDDRIARLVSGDTTVLSVADKRLPDYAVEDAFDFFGGI